MAKQEIPDWVNETHPDHDYGLVIMESGDHSVEEVELTRDEYITLKAHLAAMRGYKAITPIDAIKIVGDYCDAGSQDSARRLQAAREIYQGHPELVMTVYGEFDTELAELAK